MRRIWVGLFCACLLLAAPAQAQNYVDMPIEEGSPGGSYTDWQTNTTQYYGGGLGRMGCSGAGWFPGYYVLTTVTFETPYGQRFNYWWGWDYAEVVHNREDVPSDWDFDWECLVESWVWSGAEWVSTGHPGYSTNRTTTFNGSVPYQRGIFQSRQGACGPNLDGYWEYNRESFCAHPGGCHGMAPVIERCSNAEEYVTRDYKWIGIGHPLSPYVTLTCSLTGDRPGVRQCTAP